jgi:hypothetical protein
MGFDVADGRGIEPLVGPLVGRELGTVAGREDRAFAAIGRDAQGPQQAQRPAAGMQGFFEWLDQEGGHPFTGHDAVGVAREGLQAGIGRQGAQL